MPQQDLGPIEGQASDYQVAHPRTLKEHFSISANEVGKITTEELSFPPVYNPLAGLTEGRMVHYITADMHRAAVITKVWGTDGMVNLYVYPDGSYPLTNHTPTSVMHRPAEWSQINTWHFIERVD